MCDKKKKVEKLVIIQTSQWWGWVHTCVFVFIVIIAHLCFDLSYSRSCIFPFGQTWLKLRHLSERKLQRPSLLSSEGPRH